MIGPKQLKRIFGNKTSFPFELGISHALKEYLWLWLFGSLFLGSNILAVQLMAYFFSSEISAYKIIFIVATIVTLTVVVAVSAKGYFTKILKIIITQIKVLSLKNYDAKISMLLLENDLDPRETSKYNRFIANAITISTLNRINLDQKKVLIEYLFQSDLINFRHPVISLIKADLRGVNLLETNLHEADLTYTRLANANLQGTDLSGASLHRADLRKTNLRKANLHKADLKGALLVKANLEGANLQGANLEIANLQGANLSYTNLQDANLEGANLEGAILILTNLRGANLKGALTSNIIFTSQQASDQKS